MISVSITGQDGVVKTLANLEFKSRHAVALFAQHIFDRAQAGADSHTKTGAMARSLYLRPFNGDGWEVGHDLQHARHALFVHWGTRPHVIRPKDGGMYKSYTKLDGKRTRKGIQKGGHARSTLRFVSGGVFAFAKVVHHPGYRGDPYLSRAADDAVRNFDAIVRRAMSD